MLHHPLQRVPRDPAPPPPWKTLLLPLLLTLLLLLLLVDGGSAVVKHHDTGADGPAAAVWSKFGLVVQEQAADSEPARTTETSGIIHRAPDPSLTTRAPVALAAVQPTALGKSWTQISVTHPPPRVTHHNNQQNNHHHHHTVTASTPVDSVGSSTSTARSVSASTALAQDVRRDIPSRYQTLIGTSKPVITITFPPPRMPTPRPTVTTEEVVTAKRVRQYEDDDDDDDDDDDEDEDDDEYDVEDDDDSHHDKNDVEEIEEIVEVQHIDSDSYGDEKPAIVKKKRRRKKKGKKSKPFKVKDFKKLKKFMLPLLLAYKLKFFTLVPLMLGGLVLIVATTGFAGFFFALFAVGLGLKGGHH